jgi:hypothetical protein
MPQQTLHDFVLTLLTDQKAMGAFQLDPEGVLNKAGLADITPQDVQEAIPLVMDYADSSLTSSFVLGLDGGAGEGTLATPLGDFGAGLGVLANGDSGPTAVLGLTSPFGGVLASASPTGLSTAATGDFSALADLSDSLDSDVLSDVLGGGADPTAALVDGLHGGADMVSDGLTGGANSAASLLTAGASATAGLVGTGVDLAAGVLTDPAGAPETVTHAVTAGNPGDLPANLPVDLPVDAIDQLPTSIPVVDLGQPDHLLHDVVGQVPVGDLPLQLPGGLPLDVNDTLDTVDGVHEDVLDTVDDSAASDILQQAGVEDAVSRGPLSDVLGQSPVSDVISLTQPGGATDLVGDVTSLDEQLPF